MVSALLAEQDEGDDRKNLPEHELLIRRNCATNSEPKSKFAEYFLLYLSRSVGGFRPDVMMYILDALKIFKKAGPEKRRQIALEIAPPYVTLYVVKNVNKALQHYLLSPLMLVINLQTNRSPGK